jgi:hypothetical protein
VTDEEQPGKTVADDADIRLMILRFSTISFSTAGVT